MNLSAPEVGSPLEPFTVEAVDPIRIELGSALLDDPNPMHFDVGEVRRLGLGEATINHGPMNLAYLANVAIRFAGGPAGVRSLRGRFLGNIFAGDRVDCGGTVTAVDPERGEATLQLTARVGGREVVAGEATVALPRRQAA